MYDAGRNEVKNKGVKPTRPPRIQELRKLGLCVEEMGAHRGEDNVTKAHIVAGYVFEWSDLASLSRR
jgi:hypothetical protein